VRGLSTLDLEEGLISTLAQPSRRRAPFNPSPTIRSPHKANKGKGATKKVKRLRKIDLRSQ
jgi:hypothetical protein